MSNKVTKLQITGNFGRADIGTIEKAITASLTALNNFEPFVSVVQTNDRTLDIEIISYASLPENSNV